MLEAAFFGAAGAVDGEFGLGVKRGGVKTEQEQGKDPKDSAAHAQG